MKTYPDGTKWIVRSSQSTDPNENRVWTSDGERPFVTKLRERALSLLWNMRARRIPGITYRLVRITPRRSVEARIADAVRERTRVIIECLPAMTLEQGKWLRDLRDGKVTT